MNPSGDIFDRAILHADMDAFFASVEVLDNPALRGKPVIVGGTAEQRGVVAAASYEARRYGIHSAMSSARARRLCPHAVVLKPRFARYHEISERIFEIFRHYTPLVESLSLDEAFLDVTGNRRLFGPAESIGREIKRRIREEVGLTASVGVAPNKFLAKLASDLEKPDGFVVIPPGRVAEILAPLSVGRLWGIGAVTQKTLAGLGIHTVGDLLACPARALEERLGSWAPTLLELARGIDDRPVVPESEAKSVGAEETFARDIGNPTELRAQLDRLCERVGRRLRAEGLRARTVQIKVRYPDFATHTRARTLATPSATTQAIRQTARELLDGERRRDARPLRLLGVAVSNLERPDEGQPDLFPDRAHQRREEVDHLLDDLEDKYGPDVIRRG